MGNLLFEFRFRFFNHARTVADLYFCLTGLGPPPRNFSRQTPLHAAEFIVSHRTWSPLVGTRDLSDQQPTLAEHRAMRISPAPKHDACTVVSIDTIAIAAAQSHANGESGGPARGCCPWHRGAPPRSAEPLPALHLTTRQLDEHHDGHAILHAGPRGHKFVTPTKWAPKVDVLSRRRRARARIDTGPELVGGPVHGLERTTKRGAWSSHTEP